MAKLKIYNMAHEIVGDVELDDNVFCAEYNEPLIHQVVVALQNNARQGTKSTLTRSEVRGHAKKPWRQKGTGRARHGSTKGPQWTGGGVVFAPKPRDFSQKINKIMRDQAFASALSKKFEQNEVVLLDKIDIAQPKTKVITEMLEKFGLDKRTIIVTAENDTNVFKSASNIEKVTVTEAMIMNVLDVVKNTFIVFTVDAIKKIEEAYV
ncbi:MAG: 50S ribosomal protein L4 [Clostridia bacterium]|nr:50S ribosomal protein L4 [Clostridia bacterium]